MPSLHTAPFLNLLVASNLLRPERLRGVQKAARADSNRDPIWLCDNLVAKGWLTRWQADELLAGRTSFFVGRYELLQLLGAGGMGSVYQARRTGIERIVALKVMAPNLLGDEEAVRRFLRETQAVAALNHPHIVTAYDADRDGKSYYLVMEYVAGRDLHDWRVEQRTLPINWACECVRQAALGLHHAHERGLVHRDIKPSNLLVVARDVESCPHVKILDMGIATFMSGDGQSSKRITSTGQILGTVEYLAPEQANDTRFADARSDIFSLGCALLELLTGSTPFPGDSTMSKLFALASKDPLRLADLRPESPAELDLLVNRMLKRDPAERFQTGAEVAEALAPFCTPFYDPMVERPRRTAAHSDPEESTAEFLGLLAQQQQQQTEQHPPVAPDFNTWKPWPAAGFGATLGGVLLLWMAVAWMARPTAELRVLVNQPEAELCVDQSTVFVSPSVRERYVIHVTPGSHTLEVRKAGFESYLKSFQVEANEQVDLDVKLIASSQPVTPPTVAVQPSRPVVPPGSRPQAAPQSASDPTGDSPRDAAQWVQRLGGELTVVFDGSKRQAEIKRHSPLPSDPFQIAAVTLNKVAVSQAGLAALAGQRSLGALNLRGSVVTDAGLERLRGLDSLSMLNLEDTPITDRGIACLPKNMPQLQQLFLGRTSLSDTGVAAIKDLKELQKLWVPFTQIGDEGLRQLAAMPKLALLDLGHTKVTDAGMAHLRGMRLNLFGVDDTAVTDAGLVHLRGMVDLQGLFLNDVRVTDAGLTHLTELMNLKGLELYHTEVTAKGVELLERALPSCKIQWSNKAGTGKPADNPAPARPIAGQPLKVFILAGQMNMQGQAHVRTFGALKLDPKAAPLLRDMQNADGTPRVCDRVWISSLSDDDKVKVGKLTAGFGSEPDRIGPEFTFGIYLEQALTGPILIIKTAWGSKSLNTDFRPPGAGPIEFRTKDAQEPGHCYRLMIAHVQRVLGDPRRVCPEYDPNQGFELAGFVWFQGWSDMHDGPAYPNRDKPGGYDQYGEVLAQFIRDVRKDLSAPAMPFVIGVFGLSGPVARYEPDMARYKVIHQRFRDAMASPAALPEFQGNVVAVLTENYWDHEAEALRRRENDLRPQLNAITAQVKKRVLTRAQGAAATDRIYAEHFTAREIELVREGVSSADFHYLGSAKIMAQIGKGFAEAMMPMLRETQRP